MQAKSSLNGPLFIGIAAVLWSTDALFRRSLAQALHPTFIVFCEHLICILALLPWMVKKYGRKIFDLKSRDWLGAALIGAGASAIATVLYTESFKLTNPSIVILLQKMQPLVVILIAAVFLKEIPPRIFFFWAAIALVAALGVTFPGYQFEFSSGELQPSTLGVIAALGAAVIWAIATVVGKVVLNDVPSDLTTFWRFVFGGLALVVLLASHPEQITTHALRPELIASLFYMALLSGLAAMLFYYAGLAKTPASTATLIELIFPITAVALNAFVLHATLNHFQLAAGAVLVISITQISRIKHLSGDIVRS